MKKTEEISSFFYGQYFAEGLRITIGTIIPVIVCAIFGEFKTGTLISLGALIVGLSDTPGAPHHRKLGMFYCTILSIFTMIITCLVNNSLPLMTITIAAISFVGAMLAVFNSRASTIGMMCILIMLINIDDVYTYKEELIFLLYFIIGALWYMLVSFSIMQVRPYRLAQQELSETIIHVADYIRLKANFYNTKSDVDANYLKLIDKQVLINEHQENLRDILFQSKRSIKDTTKEGRYLTLIFNDIVDLFEQSMTTHYDYDTIRNNYAESGILDNIKAILAKITHELDNIGYKINANKTPIPIYNFEEEIDKLRIAIENYDSTHDRNSIPLKKIVINIRTITKHLKDIFYYAQFKSISIEKTEIDESKKFIKTDVLNWQSFKDNLSLNSSVFRHALRMSIVLSGTYLILNFFSFQLQAIYWILLTVLVILKPGFGLTKERNLQRLIGTVIGGIIGGLILFTIHDINVRFGILILFFLIAYSLFRVNYIMAVIFMTPYVLIMLSFTGTNSIEMAQERIIDTFIGGTIAFLSSYIIFPNWESFQIKSNMRSLLIANYQYIAQAIILLSKKELSTTDYKLARKEVYIASANMGSTFQRLLTEPKWRQNITKEVNRFVILNHIFSSYSATLMTQLRNADTSYFTNTHLRLLYKSLHILEKLIYSLEDTYNVVDFAPIGDMVKLEDGDSSSDDGKLIEDQLQFLLKITTDLQKITNDFTSKSEEIEIKNSLANG
ncbi:FUSC family protein [Sphingobacterium rhinopitheci]|uniref:FUSC family protein n=1 Tax=Sphingobacterium rhinopitheci TaxID=2781960 RepID=UPI001F51C29D|nr:FUSC family membrane protein [Sphingobacterium rhinopitheci]MCI0921075.1 FUSC family protein [Sphingobacterium rhinopitheci]